MKTIHALLTALLLSQLAALDAADEPGRKPAPARAPLPDGVEKREVTIFSDGVRMEGDLYLPKGLKADEKRPAIVICAGTGGVKAGTGRQVGAIFAQNGYVALAFDYRGWGTSDSKLITLEKQPRPDASGEVQLKARGALADGFCRSGDGYPCGDQLHRRRGKCGRGAHRHLGHELWRRAGHMDGGQ